jgi:hypothetical protein
MLTIENRGSGFLGEVGADWSITATTSPLVAGQGAGRLGALSFSARCDETTKFTIDNYVAVRHYYSDQLTRWLATFDGYIRHVNPSIMGFADFEVVSNVAKLDVERTALLDSSGTYQRSIRLPEKQEYTIASTTYTTGGSWTTVGGEQVWVPQDIAIYDVVSRNDFIYVLASGAHNGEVVFCFFADGAFRSVWPVYSDATDLAGPQSRSIAAGASSIFIGQTGADRVKIFNDAGQFTSQFGSAGTADGQFTTISDIAVSQFYNSVFVLDITAGRVQRFNYSGVYQNKWGTQSALGQGANDYKNPMAIAVDPITEQVLIADQNARVRAYDSFGNLQGTVIGAKPSIALFGESPLKRDVSIGLSVDINGMVHVLQEEHVWVCARDATGAWNVDSRIVKQWDAKNTATATYGSTVIDADVLTGQVYLARDVNYIEQYAGTPGSFVAVCNYYIALAAEDFPVRYLSVTDPYYGTRHPYASWTGSVWEMLCDLAAVTENAMVAFDDELVFFSRQDRSFQLPEDVRIESRPIDSRAAGRYVKVVNYNSRWTGSNAEVLYDALKDDRRVFSVDINGLAYYTVEQDTHPQVVFQPRAATTASPGYYTVWTDENLPITAAEWENAGGRIDAYIGEKPGTILIKVTGPGELPGGKEGPYNIVDEGGTPTLTVTGYGVITQPDTISLGTGVSEEVSNNLVAANVDTPFITNARIAHTEGSWIAYAAGTPHQRISIRLSNDRGYKWSYSNSGIGGTFQFVNAVIYHEDSEYIIDSLIYTNSQIILEGYRYNRTGHLSPAGEPTPRFEEIWNGKTAGAFDAYWAGYTAQDFTIAPLRNPFGINARTA